MSTLGTRATLISALTSHALLASCGGGSPAMPPPVATPTPAPPKPNIVFVLTDDLEVATAEMLPRLPDLIANRGVSFTRAYMAQPLCGPSRATILTGQYTHNHGVASNDTPPAFPSFRRHEANTIATWLKAAGYRTSLVGKYINGYPTNGGEDYIPPGWDDWYGHLSAMEDGRFFNYWVNDNGNVSRHGNAPEDYSVDVEARRAVSFVRSAAGRPEPIFLYLAPEAPHTPANFHYRFVYEFRDTAAPRGPSFNELDVGDKPSWIRQTALMGKSALDELDLFWVWRLRCMRAVEEQLEAVIQALAETGRLDNTYIFFTSDNGLLLGQHRVFGRKGNAYEETARVPFYVRGPNVPSAKVDRPVVSVDIVPTLLELAGAPIPDSVDGRSLVPFLRGQAPASWRTDVLIENWGLGPTYALRTPDWTYIHNDTEELELYDMKADPWQTQSLHRKVDPSVLAGFEQRMTAILACRGPSCRS
jgi:arylsulfatase A-like enzyme